MLQPKRSFALLFILPLIFCVLPLSGCDYLDIDKLVSVIGIAIDIDKDSGNYIVTAETAKTSYDQSKPVESVVLTGEGATISDALDDMGCKISGKLYFLHSELLVFSEDNVKNGISTEVDTFMRSSQTQRNIKTAIVKGSTAGDIFEAKPNTKPLISTELADAIESQADQFGQASNEKLYELYNNITAGLSDALPAIKIDKNNESSEVKLDGTAILNEGILRGYLTPEETKYYLIATGKYNEGTFSFESSKLDSDFSYRVTKCQSSCTPSLKKKQLIMEIRIEIEGTIPEIADKKFDIGQLSENGLIEDIDKQLIHRIESTVMKVQKEFEADPFYFKAQVENKYREEWPDIKENWPEYYQNAQIKVIPTVFVTSKGISK